MVELWVERIYDDNTHALEQVLLVHEWPQVNLAVVLAGNSDFGLDEIVIEKEETN